MNVRFGSKRSLFRDVLHEKTDDDAYTEID